MKLKKNAVDLTDLAIGILILGIVVTIGANILINVRDSQLTQLDTLSTTGESITGSNVTASVLDNPWFKTVDGVQNATNFVVPTSDYTVSADPVSGNGQLLLTDSSAHIGEALTVNYTYYDITQPSWAVANDAASGIAEYGNWFEIIVLVGVAGLILSLIFMAFGRQGEDSGGVSY